jgi:hypothetical protein
LATAEAVTVALVLSRAGLNALRDLCRDLSRSAPAIAVLSSDFAQSIGDHKVNFDAARVNGQLQKNVKDRLAEIVPSLPQGVTIESVYDRSEPDLSRDRNAQAHSSSK